MNRRNFFTWLAGIGTLVHVPIAKPAEIRPEAIRPGDKLVLEYDGVLRRDTFMNLRDGFQKFFPDNEVIILEGGIKLKVMREETT